MLWGLFAEAHKGITQLPGEGAENVRTQLRQKLLDDLKWARSVLQLRTNDLEEIAAARGLWHWHSRFDSDPEVKAAANELEALYTKNELALEFEPLLSRDAWEEKGQRAATKAAQLAAEKTPEAIEAFVNRAVRFLDGENHLPELFDVAWKLGEHARNNDVVRDFVRRTLEQVKVSPRTDFATVAATSWIATVRNSEAPGLASELVTELMTICGSDEQKINLIQRVYGTLPLLRETGEPLPAEHDYVRSLLQLFLKNGRGPWFIRSTAWTLNYEWPALRAVLDEVLNQIPKQQIVAAVDELINAIYWGTHEMEPTRIPQGLGTWLLDQLVRVPDMDALANRDWYIQEILKRAGQAPLSWLAKALVMRRDMELHGTDEDARAVSYQLRLSHYVARTSETSAQLPETRKAVEALVDLACDQGSVGFYLPSILREVDPLGALIPAEVARRILLTDRTEETTRFARIGAAYGVGGPSWRIIAKPVLARAALGSEEERRLLFNALADEGPVSWGGVPGEVPPMFVSEVRSRRQLLESEKDVDFQPFWTWYLALAEAALKDAEEHAKEERGQ